MAIGTDNKTGLHTEQIRAMRKCDHFTFHHYDGHSKMIGYLPNRLGEAFMTIETGHKFTQYGPRIDDIAERASCYISASGSNDNPARTMVDFFKEGDIIILEWLSDTIDSDAFRAAGLHMDELRVKIVRTERGKPKTHVFMIDYRVCLDNTARVIRA